MSDNNVRQTERMVILQGKSDSKDSQAARNVRQQRMSDNNVGQTARKVILQERSDIKEGETARKVRQHGRLDCKECQTCVVKGYYIYRT